MSSKLLAAAIGALLFLPMYAQAQQSPRLADPADPAVAVPPAVYESVIARSSPAPQDSHATPDKSWRAANDTVAGAPGHAGPGHAGPGHAGHAVPHSEQKPKAHAAAPAPASPAPPVKPAPAPVDHSKHH